MKMFITRAFAVLALAAMAFTGITVPASARVLNQGPHGAKLVLHSACRIDFMKSINWTGSTSELSEEIVWLAQQLPAKCLEDKCILVNIDPFYYSRLINPRFLAVLRNETASSLITAMKGCRINVNTPKSLGQGHASHSCTVVGNTVHLYVDGNANGQTFTQEGCGNAAFSIIDGDGNHIIVIQSGGGNVAYASITGNDGFIHLSQHGWHNNFYVHLRGNNRSYVANQNGNGKSDRYVQH